jgi:peptide/nickel transport system substrate-binding protein
VFGCGSGRVPADELVFLTELPPRSIDPRYTIEAYDYKLSKLVYAPLVSVDTPTLEPKMELAESVVPLGTDWAVSLREARFSDGRPVTADDVAYTFEQIRDPRTGGSAARLRKGFADAGLTRVEVTSPRRLVLHVSRPHAPFITDLDIGIMARPRPGTPPEAPPIGAGPFVLESHTSEIWRLAPNPYYFGGAPRVRRLTFKAMRDDNSRLLALVGGSGDLTQNTVSPLLLDAVAAQPRLRLMLGRSSVLTYLGFNCEDPILKDPRVRRAIAYAIDRPRLIQTKLRDRAVLATGLLPTFHWAYTSEVPQYRYDPAEARRLLDEAGYPDPDGDGPRPRFTLVYKTSSNKFRVALASVIVRMLAEVGIAVELRPYEFATFFADVKKGNFQLFSMAIPEIAEPDLHKTFFASSRIPTRDNLDAGNNKVRYRNPELDRLVEEGRMELDRAGRKAIYAEVQRIIARDLPILPLWHEDNVAAMRRDIRGFELLPSAQLPSLARTYKETK